jgi:hypothetical protein
MVALTVVDVFTARTCLTTVEVAPGVVYTVAADVPG